MRWLILFALLSVSSLALVLDNGPVGVSPSVYGEYVAFERDNHVLVYNSETKEEAVIAVGRNPKLFGFIVVFETEEIDEDLTGDKDLDDSVIQYSNVRDGKITNTNLSGRHPSIFSSTIFFSTKESELGIDFTNDGDTTDDIIRMFDMQTQKLTATRAVGDYPVGDNEAILVLTDEAQIATDLTVDGDMNDVVARVVERKSGKVSNANILASRPDSWKSDAAFSSEGELVLFDLKEQKPYKTGIEGTSPFVYESLVIFEREGELFSYDRESGRITDLQLQGSSPVMFEDTVVFVADESAVGDINRDGKRGTVIRFATAEDADSDNIDDFHDNCNGAANEGQEDSDNDGIGDPCDGGKPTVSEAKKELAKEEAKGNETSSSSPSVQSSKRFSWYWLLLIVVLLPFVARFGYAYYKRRQKSFGF